MVVRLATGTMPADRPVTGSDLMLDLMGILDGSIPRRLQPGLR
jgi:hypothetical protein